ncbi:hypothetical protein OHS70_01930 [Streptomyces sp. NBC_00390]|uniref:MmyB family transcriptional regulator n=1 Tax=Streptomyces sp. NBC_00390 TaxID=2975736 RepID=UPI002E216BF5
MVADLRAATARYPADTDLRSLIKDLRGVSAGFAHLWDSGIVGVHESDTKTVHHPGVGTLTLDCDVLMAPGSDLRVVAYTAVPGSDAADKLGLLRVIGTQAMTGDSSPAWQPAVPARRSRSAVLVVDRLHIAAGTSDSDNKRTGLAFFGHYGTSDVVCVISSCRCVSAAGDCCPEMGRACVIHPDVAPIWRNIS